MTRRTRRMVFYALFAVFLLLGTGIVFYAQGWRFDIFTFQVRKVGAIFVRSFPGNASITLNGKSVANDSGFLSQGTLINDLFPKNYSLTLTESGYDDWHENVSVLPSLVTKLNYEVLVPEKPAETSTGTAAQNIILGDGGSVNKIITESTTTNNYFLSNLNTGTSVNLSTPLAKAGVASASITSIALDPYDTTKIILRANDRIYVFNTAQSSLLMLDHATTTDVLLGPSVAVSPAFIAWTRFNSASNTMAIALYNIVTKNITLSSGTVPFGNTKVQWIRDGLLGISQNDGTLYTYDLSAQNFQELADEVKDFSATDDGSEIAAVEKRSLEIFALTGPQTYHRFNLPDMGNVESVTWYKDMNHLFVQYPDHASYLDINDLGLSNFTTIAQGSSSFYDAQNNAFYLMSPDQTLLRFDFPS